MSGKLTKIILFRKHPLLVPCKLFCTYINVVLLWFPSFNTFIGAIHVKQYLPFLLLLSVYMSKNLLVSSFLHTYQMTQEKIASWILYNILGIVHVHSIEDRQRLSYTNAWIISVHFIVFPHVCLLKILGRNFIQFDNNELIGLL